MSMSHVNPKSQQTKAWCEHARTTEGRIMVGFAGMRGRDQSERQRKDAETRGQSRKLKMHKKMCEYLDTFGSIPIMPDIPRGMTSHSRVKYVRILKKLGFIKIKKTVNKFHYYVRCDSSYPSVAQVTK